MKIERISTRLVKPCMTMDGPRLLVPLSNSDLVFLHEHVSVVYAYNAPAPPIRALEDGLRNVLCEYREWAGRITMDNTSGRPAILLNDAGAVLVEAQAHASLQALWPFNPSPLLLDLLPISKGVPELLLIQVPNIMSFCTGGAAYPAAACGWGQWTASPLPPMAPSRICGNSDAEAHDLVIVSNSKTIVTRFACGGVTLGIATQHQVADGVSAVEFTRAWAAVVQGLPISCPPLHDRSALMGRDCPKPVMDHIEYQMAPSKTMRYPDLTAKKLHFSAQLLRKIKEKVWVAAGANRDTVVYSTFTCLLVHLWKCITIARGLEDAEGNTGAVMPVSIRERLDPPLPREYFGNALCHTYQQLKITDLLSKPLSFAANCIHEAIKSVNNDYARSALDFIELQQKKNHHVQLAQLDKRDICVVSWAALPLYSMDFGWGTPMFAGNPFVDVGGLVFIVPSHKQDGSVDVVLSLLAPHMEKLEAICYKL